MELESRGHQVLRRFLALLSFFDQETKLWMIQEMLKSEILPIAFIIGSKFYNVFLEWRKEKLNVV